MFGILSATFGEARGELREGESTLRLRCIAWLPKHCIETENRRPAISPFPRRRFYRGGFQINLLRLSVPTSPFLFLAMSLSGSQTFKSRPDPSMSFSLLRLSWFECRRIWNGSNSVVCNAPSRQVADSIINCKRRRCSEKGCSRNNSEARLVSRMISIA